MTDLEYMEMAFAEAQLGEEEGEVPVGAVLVDNRTGEVVAQAHNRKEALQMPTKHAEMIALEEGAKHFGKYLYDATLYVTLEPCPMCAGGMIMTRLGKLVYATEDPKAGCADSVYNLLTGGRFNHKVEVVAGVCRERAQQMLKQFFAKKRR